MSAKNPILCVESSFVIANALNFCNKESLVQIWCKVNKEDLTNALVRSLENFNLKEVRIIFEVLKTCQRML